jgi:hypothetical protein
MLQDTRAVQIKMQPIPPSQILAARERKEHIDNPLRFYMLRSLRSFAATTQLEML